MGYSCTARANETLENICAMFVRGKYTNVLTINGQEYFYDVGKEQSDGAITGKLFRMLPDGKCRSAGSFRITPDGKIARFPGLSVDECRQAELPAPPMRRRHIITI